MLNVQSATTNSVFFSAGKYVISERGAIPIKGKGIMTTYWLDRAHESNVNSNDLAIAKMEVMVQEILQSGEQEDMGYPNNGDQDELSVDDADRVVELGEGGTFKGEIHIFSSCCCSCNSVSLSLLSQAISIPSSSTTHSGRRELA